MVTEKIVLTPVEVSKELHISLRFVYKLIRQGTLPHVKIGDKYLIGREAFLKWVNSGQQNA